MSPDREAEDRYEELLQIARDQRQIINKTAEDLKKLQKKVEELMNFTSSKLRL